MLPLKKILCPTDFSDFSLEAIEKGAELARHFNAQLCVLHIPPTLEHTPELTPFQDFVGFDRAQLEEYTWKNASQAMDELMNRHHFHDVQVRASMRRGDPAEEIVAAAHEEDADLLVIATHGLSGWRHLIFGSVAEKVIRLASCPVLITRVQKPEEK